MRALTEGEQAAVDRLLAARIEQGLGPTITDPETLDRAAVLWRAGCETNENARAESERDERQSARES